MLKRSILKVSNIYIEYIYEWFYQSCIDQCGDGCAVIVCENYEDAYNWFMEWLSEKKPDHLKYWQEKEITLNSINLIDNQECLIFTNDIDINIFYGDNIFIIEEDCCFFNSNKVLLGMRGK